MLESLGFLEDLYRLTGGRMGWFLVHAAVGDLTRKNQAPSASETVWNFGYRNDFPKGARLYQLAKQMAWDPQTDIDWSARPAADAPLISDACWLPHSMGLADVLTERERVKLNRETIAWTISQLLHGEQGSLLICSQLVDMREDLDGKLFLSAQVMDEARHIEVLRRYLAEMGLLFPIDLNVKVVIDSLLAQRSWRKKAIGMLILVEGYALGAFAYHRSGTTDPLLRQILGQVMQDEGRHVAFGIDSIAEEAQRCGKRERAGLEDFAYSVCRSVFFARERGGFRTVLKLFREADRGRMGLDRKAFEARAADCQVMQDVQREVFVKNLVPNLKRLGLISDRIRPKYMRAGIPV